MKHYNVNVLAFTETVPGHFALIGQNIAKGHESEIHLLDVPKDSFRIDGKIVWDLCSATEFTGYRVGIDGTYRYLSGCKFYKKVPVKYLKQTLLEQTAISFGKFSEDDSIRYAIVKAIGINQITWSEDRKCTYLKINFDNNLHKNEMLLNKDYRWKRYWDHLPEEQRDEKMDFYKNLFNRPGKQLYFVLYRHTFQDGRKYAWIAGMHWL